MRYKRFFKAIHWNDDDGVDGINSGCVKFGLNKCEDSSGLKKYHQLREEKGRISIFA